MRQGNWRVRVIIVFLLCVVSFSTVSGEIITVDDDGVADFNNIQGAIDDSNDGDLVIVFPGTYSGEGNYNISFGGRAITVSSVAPEDPYVVAHTIIDCNLINKRRAFMIIGGKVTVAGLRIINSHKSAIYCRDSEPTIQNCVIEDTLFYSGLSTVDSNVVISNCTIRGGGTSSGIYVEYGNMVISGCVIEDCTYGVYIEGEDTETEATIANCIIRNNTDSGIYCSYVESISITDCIVENNTEGGIYLEYVDSILIKGCSVTGNVVEGKGGGICVNPSYLGETVSIEDCIISDNVAGGDGGGIYSRGGNTTIERSVISRNKSLMRFGGGGYLSIYNGQLNIKNSVFSCNSAEVGGGIVILRNSHSLPSNIANCIFSGNMAGSADFVGSNYYGNITNCTFVGNYPYKDDSFWGCRFSNCIIWNNRGGDIFGPFYYVDPVYNCIEGGHTGLGNIDVDPCFVDPGYWDANGTPGDANDDYWVEGDYHLKSEGWRWDVPRGEWTWDDVTSLCIDAGNPGAALGEELLSVPDHPDNEWGENVRINMGAYGGTSQASMGPVGWPMLADLNNDRVVDFADVGIWTGYWLDAGDELPGDLNRDGVVDWLDYCLVGRDFSR